MAYKKKTIFYGIPIPSKGDRIQEAEETIARNIIENQLLAGTKGVRCSVFEEGYFKLVNNNDGTYSVALIQNNARYALCGIVGGAYVESKEPILWDGLENGYEYYLYVQFTDKLFQDEHAFRVISTSTKKVDDNGIFLLLAQVDLKSEEKKIETYPDGKIYSSDIASHSNDTTNPHGEKLIQDNLIVRESLKIEVEDSEELKEASFLISDKRKGIANIESKNELTFKDVRGQISLTDESNSSLTTNSKTLFGAINELNVEKNLVMDIPTNGKEGFSLSVADAKEISFVSYHRLQASGSTINDAKELGDVSIGYFGMDEKVQNAQQCKLYNTGDSNVKLRVKIFYK